MFVAGIGRARPDAIDKAKLLHLLQMQKRLTANDLEFAWPQGNQVVQTIAHGTERLLIRQKGQPGLISPLAPVLGLDALCVFGGGALAFACCSFLTHMHSKTS